MRNMKMKKSFGAVLMAAGAALPGATRRYEVGKINVFAR